MRILVLVTLIGTTAAVSALEPVTDPTRPPTAAEIEAWFGNGTDDSRSRSPFELQSVLLSPQRRIAIIDGERLRIGERIDNALVRRIEPGLVVLERDGTTIELTIDTHLINHQDGSRD
jgi:MSHA biogenesis protein MshK